MDYCFNCFCEFNLFNNIIDSIDYPSTLLFIHLFISRRFILLETTVTLDISLVMFQGSGGFNNNTFGGGGGFGGGAGGFGGGAGGGGFGGGDQSFTSPGGRQL